MDQCAHQRSRSCSVRIIDPWRHVLHMLAVRPDIDRVGLSADLQMVWVNFFWTRASVVAQLVQPVVYQQYRYYFEHWLGAYNATRAGVSQHDPRIAAPHPYLVLLEDGSVHLAGCASSMSLMCKNATHPRYYVVGQCVNVDAMNAWQGSAVWKEAERPSCDCDNHECGVLDQFA